MSQLGTLEELPLEYRQALTDINLGPLWHKPAVAGAASPADSRDRAHLVALR